MWAGGEGISSSFFAHELKRLDSSELSSNKSTLSSLVRSRFIVAFSTGWFSGAAVATAAAVDDNAADTAVVDAATVDAVADSCDSATDINATAAAVAAAAAVDAAAAAAAVAAAAAAAVIMMLMMLMMLMTSPAVGAP